MPFYLVTIKNPGRTPRYHEKEIGPCNTSPNCTDSGGAHHTYLAKALDIQLIFAAALKEGVHITRVEEVYHVRDYEVADVSVRDDSDRPVGLSGAISAFGVTEFDATSVPGFDAIPLLGRDERLYYSVDPHNPHRPFGGGYRDDSTTSHGEVSAAPVGEQEDNPFAPKEKGDYRIGPDGDGVIRS